MAYFEFPHTRTYDTDLGWLIASFKEISEKLDQYLENAVIKFADPITWDITEQYTALTCVIDSDGTAYLSKQPVPAGVDISNTNYWLPIFNYDDNMNTLRSQIAYNAGGSPTSTTDLNIGDLVFWNGYLYQAIATIPTGSAFVDGTNIDRYTVDEKINSVYTDVDNIRNQIAYNAGNSATTTIDLAPYDLVFWNGTLYRATVAMPAGTAFIIGTNIEPYSVDDKIKYVQSLISQGAIKTYRTMADMIADFTQDDAFCYVENSYIKFNGVGVPFDVPCRMGNYYEYKNANDIGEHYYPLANGGFAAVTQHELTAIPNDPEILPKVLLTGYSYTGVYKTGGFNIEGQTVYNVRYAAQSGPYFDTAAEHQGMQCSQFVNTLLEGLPYERSKLADELYINMPSYGEWPGILLDDGTKWRGSAEEMAQYAFATGSFIETDDIEEARVGDIVFFSSTAADTYYRNWKNIVHCAMVIGKVRGVLQVLQCGGISYPPGFAGTYIRPGESTDGVNTQCIYVADNYTNTHMRGDAYWMAGIARFNMRFAKIAPHDTFTIAPIAETAYAAAAANYQLAPDPIPGSPAKNALFAIADINLTTGAIDNNSNFYMAGWTYSTAFPAQTGQTIFTGAMSSAGGILTCPFRKDGNTKTIRLAMIIRTRDTTSGSYYKLDSGLVETYI